VTASEKYAGIINSDRGCAAEEKRDEQRKPLREKKTKRKKEASIFGDLKLKLNHCSFRVQSLFKDNGKDKSAAFVGTEDTTACDSKFAIVPWYL
jgi:hypothetical protein